MRRKKRPQALRGILPPHGTVLHELLRGEWIGDGLALGASIEQATGPSLSLHLEPAAATPGWTGNLVGKPRGQRRLLRSSLLPGSRGLIEQRQAR